MMPPALAVYLFLARSGRSLGDRIIARRITRGKGDPKLVGERQGIARNPRPKGEVVCFVVGSVNEAMSVVELIRKLHDEDSSLQFLIATTTDSASSAVTFRLPENTQTQLVPIDVAPFVDAFLDHWKPDLVVWTDRSLWPTLITTINRIGTPMILINGKMSLRRFKKWRYLAPTFRRLLSGFAAIHVQDEETREFLLRLRIPAQSVEVTGTLKEGSSALPHDEAERQKISESIGRRATWFAAHTQADEEEMVARAHREVLRRAPRTMLVVTPDDLDRGPEVAQAYRDIGWRTVLRSSGEPLNPDTEIYVADCPDELGLWYRIATISFLGGSFGSGSGNNPLEPAALGTAILHGPDVENYRDTYQRLSDAGACRLVNNTDEMAKEVTRLLAPDEVAKMALAAWEVCSSGASVTDKALESVLDNLWGSS